MKNTIENRGIIVMRIDGVPMYGQVYFLKCKRKRQTIRRRQTIRQRQTKSQKKTQTKKANTKKTIAQQSREQMEKVCPAKYTFCKFPMSMFG